PSTAAGTRRRAGSSPPGALCFPLVTLTVGVVVLGVLGLDKPGRLQALENFVDVVVYLGDLELLDRLSRRTASIGRVGEPGDQGFADNVEADVALRKHFEKGLPKTLIELRQRIEVVPQLVSLAADFDGHIAPMLVSHNVPPFHV